MNIRNTSLATYVELRSKYFGNNPTNLPFDQLTAMLYSEMEDLPIVDTAIILQLLREDHAAKL